MKWKTKQNAEGAKVCAECAEYWVDLPNRRELLRSLLYAEGAMDEFLKAALVSREWHASGTLDAAEELFSLHPEYRTSNIYTAAVLGDEAGVRFFLSQTPEWATAPGGPYGWDALTHLCFSRYLRLRREQSPEFVRTARVLLEAGADPNTSWFEAETIDGQTKQQIETAIYGAAGFAQNAELTRLLLEFGADPNDPETPYHAPETYDNAAVLVLLESGKLTPASKAVMLVRKADWHDQAGMHLVLERAGNPNLIPPFGFTALQHALRRGNRLPMIELLLDHGADPSIRNSRDGRTGAEMAARGGRGDVLDALEHRGIPHRLQGVDLLIAACARGDRAEIQRMVTETPELRFALQREDGALLAEFAGIGNREGVICLLELGVPVEQTYVQVDGYWGIGKETTALHMAAWRAWPEVVIALLERGASPHAIDGCGKTPLALAVRACVDSYWTDRRSPESVEALLDAGAILEGVDFPCGYEDVDRLLSAAARGTV